jgi:hypothetical protein
MMMVIIIIIISPPRPNEKKHNATTSSTSPINYLEAFEHGMKTNYSILGSPKLSDKTKTILDHLYTPHNQILSRLLQDNRWRYERTKEEQDRPLVWPMRKENDGGALFLGPEDDGDLDPCTSRVG